MSAAFMIKLGNHDWPLPDKDYFAYLAVQWQRQAA